MARVLVTGVGRPAGSSLARQLKGRGHWVLGVDSQRAHPGAADIVAAVSPPSAPGYLWELRGLVATYGIELLIPTNSGELVLMSGARSDFAPGVEVMVADPAPVRTAGDKFFTMTCLASAGVSVPAFGLPSVLGTVHDAMDRLGGPLVVKPRVSRDGRGVRLLERTSDGGARAERIWATLDDSWLVQRLAPGTEYASVVLRCGAPAEAVNLAVILEKSVSKETGLEDRPSVRRVDDPDISQLVASAAAALGLTGPVGVDVRRLQDGTPVVLEVEARIGAHSAQVPELLDTLLGRYVQGHRWAKFAGRRKAVVPTL